MREVAACLHHDEPCIRQALMPQLRILRRHDFVIVPSDDQRR
jgi:hypothetical protein